MTNQKIEAERQIEREPECGREGEREAGGSETTQVKLLDSFSACN